jgi:hypothetical protein
MVCRGPYMNALSQYLAREESNWSVLEQDVSANQQKYPDICLERTWLEPRMGYFLSCLVCPDQFRVSTLKWALVVAFQIISYVSWSYFSLSTLHNAAVETPSRSNKEP